MIGDGDYAWIPEEDLGGFRRAADDRLIATPETAEASGEPASVARHVTSFLFGRPLTTGALETERMSILRALPILSSDALSSVAYGPEAGLSVLATAGAGALIFNVPVGIAVAVLMIIVTTSYRQVVRGYQAGGGSYAVARANLGLVPGLVAAAALLVDYVLTVAVSVSSGVDALGSALPAVSPYGVPIATALIALLIMANLRGAREAGTIFAGPTYLFVAVVLLLIVVGLGRGVFGGHAITGHYAPLPASATLTPLLVLTAFASGCSSMTGIEAVSNSVPSFQRPEAEHAARTLTILGTLLVVLFLGVVALDVVYRVEPHPDGHPTVLSQLAADVFSGPASPVYYLFQFATLLILVLAANTSFNGFPRLGAILARDHFLPHRFAHLGSRLVYSTAIVLLGAGAAALIIAFRANTDSLINLYALGVFTAFTLAQLGMALHWLRNRGSGWRRRLVINGCGALITAVVDIVIIVTKAPRGAWVVLIIIPFLVLLLWGVSRYYCRVRRELAALSNEPQHINLGPAIVLAVALDPPTRAAVKYAMTLSSEVLAVHFAASPKEAHLFREEWARYRWPAGHLVPRLSVLVAGRRRRLRSFLTVVRRLQANSDHRIVTVVLPQWEPRRGIQGLLSRPALSRFKLALRRLPDVIAVTVPSSAVTPGPPPDPDRREGHVAIVPIENLDVPARRALAYATSVSSRVIALHVETQVEDAHQHEDSIAHHLDAWRNRPALGAAGGSIRYVVVESPFRSVVPPLLAYIDSWRHAHPEPRCTVVLPEFVSDRWWAYGLHNQRAFWLKTALLARATVAVADVTYHHERG